MHSGKSVITRIAPPNPQKSVIEQEEMQCKFGGEIILKNCFLSCSQN